MPWSLILRCSCKWLTNHFYRVLIKRSVLSFQGGVWWCIAGLRVSLTWLPLLSMALIMKKASWSNRWENWDREGKEGVNRVNIYWMCCLEVFTSSISFHLSNNSAGEVSLSHFIKQKIEVQGGNKQVHEDTGNKERRESEPTLFQCIIFQNWIMLLVRLCSLIQHKSH